MIRVCIQSKLGFAWLSYPNSSLLFSLFFIRPFFCFVLLMIYSCRIPTVCQCDATVCVCWGGLRQEREKEMRLCNYPNNSHVLLLLGVFFFFFFFEIYILLREKKWRGVVSLRRTQHCTDAVWISINYEMRRNKRGELRDARQLAGAYSLLGRYK